HGCLAARTSSVRKGTPMNELHRPERQTSSARETLLQLLLRKEGIDRERSTICRRGRDEKEVPASFAQQRLWLLEQLNARDPAYIIPFEVGLSGALDPRALEATLREIVKRHEVLRTVYTSKEGRPFQVIRDGGFFSCQTTDLSELSTEHRNQAIAS